MEKLQLFLRIHKTTAILAIVLTVFLGGGFFAFQSFNANRDNGIQEEINLGFDPEGPYALFYPRRDGNALVLNLKRTSSYDEISYELAYTSLPDTTRVEGIRITDEEGSVSGSIDRGVAGAIDTKDKRGEYEQEILFGSCSKNVCKYDKGVENGTLTLKIRKGSKTYKMISQWHLQKVDIALGMLNSLDGHFNYTIADRKLDFSIIGFSIINELTGVPKLPSKKEILGKVYALNVPLAKELPTGKVSIELAENPSTDAKIYRYNSSGNNWEELDTKIEGAKLTASSNGAGIFAVLTSKK